MKTEKPTPRKLKKEAEKGKNFSSRDLTVVTILIGGLLATAHLSSFEPFKAMYREIIKRRFDVGVEEMARLAATAFIHAAGPVVVICMICTVVASLCQSRGILATKAIRIDFTKLNPATGFKNLFSLKPVKELVRSILLTVVVTAVAVNAWHMLGPRIFALTAASPATIAEQWKQIALSSTFGVIVALLPLVGLSAFVDYLMYVRDLRMDKSEVKQERKDNDGNPEIKQKRKQLAADLSAQDQADVVGSSVVLANPTHYAVGIFVHDFEMPMPFVSIREKGERALKVIALAERAGIPVVRDRQIARTLYANSRRYGFVKADQLDGVLRIIRWLRDVERTHKDEDADPGHAS